MGDGEVLLSKEKKSPGFCVGAHQKWDRQLSCVLTGRILVLFILGSLYVLLENFLFSYLPGDMITALSGAPWSA
jgi:hypothetical protein